MPPAQRKGPFNEGELLNDAAAEAEELGQQSAEQPTQTPEPTAEGQQTSPPEQPTEPEPKLSPRAEERFQKLANERAQAIRERDELREQWARLDERRKQVDEARKAAEYQTRQQQEAAQRPDPNIDPVGAELFDLRQWKQQQEAWRQQVEQNFGQLQQSYQVDRQTQDFNNWVVAEAQTFSRQQPDYPDAAQHAANWRMQWWQELGLPQEQARQMVIHESNLLAQISRQSGKPFAPVIYRLAQSVGYRPAGAANGNGNGAPSSAVTSAAGRILSQAAKGQSMQGLGRVPSAGNEAKSRYRDMSAADIAALSEAEWARAFSDPATRAELEYAMKKADGVLDYEDVNYGGRR